MKLRTSPDGFRAALLVALAGTACGGTTRDAGRSANVGGADTDPGTGGASSATGGGVSAGGRATGGTSTGGTSTGGTSTGGTSTGGTSTGGTSTGGNPPRNDPRYTTCNHPTPMEPGGGFESCDTGVVHRKTASDCPSSIDPNDSPPNPTPADQCTKNSDCTAMPNGYCTTQSAPGVLSPPARCVYGCVRDSECGAGFICFCASPVGYCLSATCTSDAACPDHLLCLESYSTVGSGCGVNDQFNCGPMCVTDADCASVPTFASYGPAKCVRGDCAASGPACGRPFLVHGAARSACPARRNDWSDGAAPDVTALSPAAREKLAAHYTQIALMEHASVAAFARFVLELLSMGAPSDLVDLAGAAMRDETRHAAVCFGLASAYAGRNVGPGPLPIAGALAPSSIEERLLTVLREACIGETVAALEVAEAAEHASDATVAAILRGIAQDEMEHATLGFRFLKWALGTLPDAERAAVHRAMRAALAAELAASTPESANTEDDAALARHGVLPESLRRTVRAKAISDVVVPCVSKLFEARAGIDGMRDESV